MKMKVGIIDDEQHGREYIALLLQNEFPKLEIAFAASGVNEALTQLKASVPDILFLDVELGNKTVFDILDRIEADREEIQLIFVTAYEHYAIRAIKNNANDYLLKPIQPDEFIKAVQKAVSRLEKAGNVNVEPEHLQLPTKNGITKVAVSSIIRCEADSNYTSIYSYGLPGRIVLSKTLQEVEQSLESYGFFRVHHKHLVNLAHVVEYVKGKGGEVVLTDGTVIPVSLRRKTEFLRLYKTV